MNKKILLALIVVLVAVCGVSTYFHIKGRIESEENKKMYETVAEEVSATEDITAFPQVKRLSIRIRNTRTEVAVIVKFKAILTQ